MAGTSARVAARTLSLSFDRFGWGALETEAAGRKGGLSEILECGALHFESMPPGGRRFARRVRVTSRSAGAVVRELALELPGQSWTSLIQEAERQEVPLERLLEHAALLYLADLDSGQATPGPGLTGKPRPGDAQGPSARF